ncbi:PspC domain-containing protein [Marinobacterium arenosum]|uniref:PspC domain-containing protein n=1 Tax=Marinobacterium arenosum TaxID=2862496 RepID=UPI001C985096|nr:PspC domain-containing protein [Marinobacterium arenosum]MBY4676184.1 PspC domain-containing protein [Marinobacterium arenosum]
MFEGKRNGYDMDLYRSRDDRWIAGVCGGIAENLGWPSWLVRLLALTLFAFTGSLAVIAYLVAVVMLANRPVSARKGYGKPGYGQPGYGQPEYERSSCRRQGRRDSGHNLKDRVFNYGPSPAGRVTEVRQRMEQLEQRLRAMERYVTSRKYQFDQELNRPR